MRANTQTEVRTGSTPLEVKQQTLPTWAPPCPSVFKMWQLPLPQISLFSALSFASSHTLFIFITCLSPQ